MELIWETKKRRGVFKSQSNAVVHDQSCLRTDEKFSSSKVGLV